MRKSPSREEEGGEGWSPLSFDRPSFSNSPPANSSWTYRDTRDSVLDRISPWKIEKKPWAHFLLFVASIDQFSLVERKKERKKGRRGKKRKRGSRIRVNLVVSRYKTETLQRELDCPSWLTIYLIAIVFYAPTVYFCFRGPPVFHLSYVRGGCYQVEELLVRGWSVRIGKTINRRYYFCRIISQSRNRRRSWSS